MKRSILFLAYAITMALASRAQTGAANTSPIPPGQPLATQRAIHELENMQERLVDLTQEQVITMNSILLDKNIALDSLRDHLSGDQKTDNQCRHNIFHDADVRIYSLLNDNQQVQYVLWKQEQRIKNLEKRQQAQNQAAQAAQSDSTNHPHG